MKQTRIHEEDDPGGGGGGEGGLDLLKRNLTMLNGKSRYILGSIEEGVHSYLVLEKRGSVE